ncbi:hypothetical protein AC790_02260 [Pantoea sp. RIT-PI-b]|nr:hypothetical protein AC790_02260 [Pantoea sp. RIT-PI-b]
MLQRGVEATSLPAERVRDSRASRRDAARGGAEQERIAAGPSGILRERRHREAAGWAGAGPGSEEGVARRPLLGRRTA